MKQETSIELTPRLKELKRRFIVPDSTVADLAKQHKRLGVFDNYYCPYAPCCSDCKGIFTFRELLGHLRRVHEHDATKIKRPASKGFPKVPNRRVRKGDR